MRTLKSILFTNVFDKFLIIFCIYHIIFIIKHSITRKCSENYTIMEILKVYNVLKKYIWI